jgi:hypothetical protein
MAVTITLEDDEALVLFEWLSREVDDRNGERLAPVLVSPGEFWALNAAHCLLEAQMVAPFRQDYREAVLAARARLTPAPEDTALDVACAGEDSGAMAGGSVTP